MEGSPRLPLVALEQVPGREGGIEQTLMQAATGSRAELVVGSPDLMLYRAVCKAASQRAVALVRTCSAPWDSVVTGCVEDWLCRTLPVGPASEVQRPPVPL